VIVDVEAMPARTYDEVEATKRMIELNEARFHLSPKRLIAGTNEAGGSESGIANVRAHRDIEGRVPGWICPVKLNCQGLPRQVDFQTFRILLILFMINHHSER
jgi:hypothetical protein